ncbi:MAG: helicase-related protein [Aerococcus sp.]|nr:helicase-related protein [Aerococcus sp.]
MEAKALSEQLYGRLALAREVGESPEKLEQLPGVRAYPAISQVGRRWVCRRCGNEDQKQFQANFCNCHRSPCVYCLACAQFGIIRACDTLYTLRAPLTHSWQREASYLTWEGQRSTEQEEASREVVASYLKQQDHLIWAVTGAGKTEMIFPVIDEAMKQGQRVAIATPRLDVCNELYPRFQAAFQGVEIALLHSQSDQPYACCPLTIVSTHQLVRFEQAFSLVIIDEVDAFPFHNDPMLHSVAKRAVKRPGTLVLLTATPDPSLKRQSQRHTLATSLLPARYHRHPLPLPTHQLALGWATAIQKGQCPRALTKIITRWLKEPCRFLIFMPNIALMRALEEILHRQFPNVPLASVSAKDDERLSKVEKMRQGEYAFLLTTTILERGVTFEGINVVVLGSEQAVFTTSALVQISGRVGRKPNHPTGEVIFLHEGKTKASIGAIKQIQRMNQLAKMRQLLD